jgi:hypothetical protein
MTPEEYKKLAHLAKCFPNGDVVIAGTWNGEDVRTIKKIAPNRNIVVIDSFEGLAEPYPKDIKENHMKAGECNVGGLKAYLKTFEGTGISPPKEIYKMWIDKESLSIIPKRDVGFLFLDLDHYKPTKDCLEFFSSWLLEESVVLVHDYDFIRCPGIKKCCDEFGGDWRKIPGTGFGRYYREKIKLEIGSGPYPRKGYIHLDINEDCEHVEIVSAANEIPLHEETVSELIAVNILEHVEWIEVENVLKEWGRVLATNGTLLIHVPDMDWLLKFLPDETGEWKKAAGNQPFNAAVDKWQYMNHYIMSTDVKYNLHRSVFTYKTLVELLKRAGFKSFKRINVEERWLYVQAQKK